MHAPTSKRFQLHRFREFDRVKANRLDPSQPIRSLAHLDQLDYLVQQGKLIILAIAKHANQLKHLL
jgi:hypothetical protein